MYEFPDLIIVFVIAVVVTLLIRQFWLWYWKINKLIEGQNNTNELLNSLVRIVSSMSIPSKNEDYGQAKIVISGDKQSNYILLAAIEESGQFKDLMENPNNEAEIQYTALRDARNSLHEAHGRLCGAEPDIVGERDGIKLFDDILYYKHSKAEIIT